jgi:hypothetical protein
LPAYQNADAPSQACKQNAFGEKLPDQSCAASAHRRPYRYFTFTAGAPNKQQICQIHAANQQHCADRREKHQKSLPQIIVDHRVRVAGNRCTPSLVRLRVVVGDPHGDGVHLLTGLLQGYAGFQASE